MKKRALYTDTFREIKKSLNRFLSIMMIVFLGVGFFVGIKATAPSMRATAEKYFNDTSLMDIQILSTTGFEKDDVLAISETDGVSKVMPSYRTDLILKTDTGSLVARVSSVPGGDPVFDTINDLTLLEGRMPEAENECLVSMLSFSKRNFDVGDIITFDETAGSTSTDGILANRTFKVVGSSSLLNIYHSTTGRHPSETAPFHSMLLYRPQTSCTRVSPSSMSRSTAILTALQRLTRNTKTRSAECHRPSSS